jgi:hypothetical protein
MNMREVRMKHKPQENVSLNIFQDVLTLSNLLLQLLLPSQWSETFIMRIYEDPQKGSVFKVCLILA